MLPLVDLKLREEKIRLSLNQNPTIKKLFCALYALHPETNRQNCFGQENLDKLIHALQTQGFSISLDYRDSHYCIILEGTYGYMDQEQFAENAPGVKAHNSDHKFFSSRTLNGFRKMFMRAGLTPEVLGISPHELATGTVLVQQDLTHSIGSAATALKK